MSNENSCESSNTTTTPIYNPKMFRLYYPTIPNYPLNVKHVNTIVNQFVLKVEKNIVPTYEILENLNNSSLKYGMDIRLIDNLKYQFENVELRRIDMRLLKEIRMLRREIEKLMIVYYKLYEKEKGKVKEGVNDAKEIAGTATRTVDKNQHKDRFMLILGDYIRGRKTFLERIEEIREKINVMVCKAEKTWNYLKLCQAIANKK